MSIINYPSPERNSGWGGGRERCLTNEANSGHFFIFLKQSCNVGKISFFFKGRIKFLKGNHNLQ